MNRKPVIRKGFAGVTNSDFVKKKMNKENETVELSPEDKHNLLVERLNSWLRANCAHLVDTFARYDQRGSGTVTKDEFSEGLQSMRAPFTSNEVHFITSFLTEKPLRLKVDYLVFAKGVNIPFPILDNFTSENIKLKVRDLSTPQCSKCCLKIPPLFREDSSNSIKLNLMLIQFLDKSIPCNFTEFVKPSLTIYGVKELVQHSFNHSLLDVKIYTEKTGNIKPLDDELTLYDIGYKGDKEDVTLYYDVHVNVHVNIEFTHPFYSCPLLLTDHYFAKHSTSA